MGGWFLNKPEKRNHKRVDCDLPVDLKIEGKSISASVTNISCGGLFLPIKKDLLKERTDIQMMINLPEQKKEIRVVGEVARYQDTSFLGLGTEGVAIRFSGLYDDNILAIDKYIKKNHN
jgi:hypothetical protein